MNDEKEAQDDNSWEPIKIEDLAKLFKRSKSNIQRKLNELELIENEDFFKTSPPGCPPTYFFHLSGAIKIAELPSLTSPESEEFLRKYNKIKHKKIRKESYYLGIIESSVNGITRYYRYHYICGYQYNIDLYFPELKLAVECDEYNHKNYDQAKEKIRQEEIERECGCTFIRFDPDEASFNIGNIINKIFLKILENGEHKS